MCMDCVSGISTASFFFHRSFPHYSWHYNRQIACSIYTSVPVIFCFYQLCHVFSGCYGAGQVADPSKWKCSRCATFSTHAVSCFAKYTRTCDLECHYCLAYLKIILLICSVFCHSKEKEGKKKSYERKIMLHRVKTVFFFVCFFLCVLAFSLLMLQSLSIM